MSPTNNLIYKELESETQRERTVSDTQTGTKEKIYKNTKGSGCSAFSTFIGFSDVELDVAHRLLPSPSIITYVQARLPHFPW